MQYRHTYKNKTTPTAPPPKKNPTKQIKTTTLSGALQYKIHLLLEEKIASH